MFKYFWPSARVHGTWIQSTTKYRSWFRIALSNCCLRRHKTVWSTKLLMSASVSVAKGRHAEHFICWIFGFFTNLFIFFTGAPLNLLCPNAPAVRNLVGTCHRQLYGAQAPAPMSKFLPHRLYDTAINNICMKWKLLIATDWSLSSLLFIVTSSCFLLSMCRIPEIFYHRHLISVAIDVADTFGKCSHIRF